MIAYKRNISLGSNVETFDLGTDNSEKFKDPSEKPSLHDWHQTSFPKSQWKRQTRKPRSRKNTPDSRTPPEKKLWTRKTIATE